MTSTMHLDIQSPETTSVPGVEPGGVNSGRGRKVRTSDCARCVIMRGLIASGLPVSSRDAICQRMWLNRVRRRQILYAEGNQATHLYAIRSGRVKLVKVDSCGREHFAQVLVAGDLFGFEAVFDSAYATGAETLSEGELCLASGQELKDLMGENARFAIDLAQYLHRQLSEARERQSYVAGHGAVRKVAGYLLAEVRQGNGEEEGAEDPVVPRNLTLRDLGAILGMSPETVCRALGELRARGVTAQDAVGIRIRDLATLRRLAAS